MHPCTSLQFHFIRSHIGRVHVCLAVTCNLHFWQNGRNRLGLGAAAVSRGWKGYRNKESAQKVDHQKTYSSTAPARTRTRDLLIVRRSTTQLPLLPFVRTSTRTMKFELLLTDPGTCRQYSSTLPLQCVVVFFIEPVLNKLGELLLRRTYFGQFDEL